MRISEFLLYKYAYATVSILSSKAYEKDPEAELVKQRILKNQDAYYQELHDKSYNDLTAIELSIRIRARSLG